MSYWESFKHHSVSEPETLKLRLEAIGIRYVPHFPEKQPVLEERGTNYVTNNIVDVVEPTMLKIKR